MRRWILETLDGAEQYTFPINPSSQDSPHPSDDVSWSCNTQPTQATFAGLRTPAQPVDWSFTGVLRTQAQYDDMLAWAGRRTKLRLITDLPETLIVRLLGFAPERTGPPRRNVLWRHTYQVKAKVYSYDSGIPAGVTAPRGSTVVAAPTGIVQSTIFGLAASITTAAPAGTASSP